MSSTAKAHGMDGTLVEPDWPPLTLAEVRPLLAQFPASASPRKSSPSARARFPRPAWSPRATARVFIKRHHRAVRDREGLLEEHRFLSHLLAHGAPVPRVLASAAGETAIEIGEWTYEVHETPPGIDLYEDAISWTPFRSAAHAHSAGAGARAAPSRRAAISPPRPASRARSSPASPSSRRRIPRKHMARYLAAPSVARRRTKPSAPARSRRSNSWRPFTPSLRRSCLRSPPLWTHNDLHASNLFWSDAGPDADCAHATAIIDFGLADRTNAVHDLAHAIERNIVEWLVARERSCAP